MDPQNEDPLLKKLVNIKRKAREDTTRLINDFDNWCIENYQNQWMIEYLYSCNR